MDPRSLPVSKASTKRPSHFSTTPSDAIPKKNRVGGIQTEKLKAAAEINDKQKSRSTEKAQFNINIVRQTATYVHLQNFQKGLATS